jgi:hypothetical protein
VSAAAVLLLTLMLGAGLHVTESNEDLKLSAR